MPWLTLQTVCFQKRAPAKLHLGTCFKTHQEENQPSNHSQTREFAPKHKVEMDLCLQKYHQCRNVQGATRLVKTCEYYDLITEFEILHLLSN